MMKKRKFSLKEKGAGDAYGAQLLVRYSTMTGLTRRRRKGVPGPVVSGYDVGCGVVVVGFANPSPPVLVMVNVLMARCLLYRIISGNILRLSMGLGQPKTLCTSILQVVL